MNALRLKPVVRWLLAMAYTAFALAAVITAHDWWQGEIADMRWHHWLLLASVPLLAWIYLRYLSVFAPGNGQCLLPQGRAEPQKNAPVIGSPLDQNQTAPRTRH